MRGDSFERQTKKAAEYASAHGLDLDTTLTFQDLGVSAYRSRNAATGALRAFLDGVEEGDIPKGSYLLVESLDRISRDQIYAAQGLFLQIIGAGITLVTLIDDKAYSKDGVNSNPTDLIVAIVSMMRAHDQSAVKSIRVASAYEHKRQRAAAGDVSKPFTRILRAWLCWDEEHQQHRIIEERGAVVRDIFEKALAGGPAQDCTLAERSSHTDMGRGTPSGLLAPIIRAENPHQSCRDRDVCASSEAPDANGKRQRKALDPIPNHYPAVVDRETFDSVASRFSTPAPRGRHANQAIRSLFSGVLRCSRCGATVSRACKGEHVYLICARVNSLGVAAGPHPHRPIPLFPHPIRSNIANSPSRTGRVDSDAAAGVRRPRLQLLALHPAHAVLISLEEIP
jgi:DNA invertase Pin-like site-specific DNA recombinase